MHIPKKEILALHEEAVQLEESVTTDKRSETLALLYKVKAALLEYEGNKSESKKFFTKAVSVYREN